MSLWTSLEPVSTTVDAGSTATVRLRLRNTGDIVDEYRFVPVGDIAPYTTVEPPTMRLYPGTTGTVELTFAPPRTPDSAAGPHPYAVQVIPTEHAEATTVPEGNLTITPFTEVRAELVPHTVRGRFRGRPKLAVDNYGNTTVTASVVGNDNGEQLGYELFPANVQIEPGRAAFVKTVLRPRQIIWFGHKQQRPYRLSIRRSGSAPLDVEGTYVQPGFLPRWLLTMLGLLLALGAAFAALWAVNPPSFASEATAQPIQPSAGPLSPTPTPAAPPTPSQPPTPTTAAQTTSSSQSSQKGSGGGGGGAKKKPTNPYQNVTLFNPVTGMCASLANPNTSGGATVQHNCTSDGSRNERWTLRVVDKNLGPHNKPLYEIRNIADGYCMGLQANGAGQLMDPVNEYACRGTASNNNQLWWLDRQKDGSYWIRNYLTSGLCLDVAGYPNPTNGQKSDKTDGDNFTLYNCSTTNDQEWQIQQH